MCRLPRIQTNERLLSKETAVDNGGEVKHSNLVPLVYQEYIRALKTLTYRVIQEKKERDSSNHQAEHSRLSKMSEQQHCPQPVHFYESDSRDIHVPITLLLPFTSLT